MNQVECFGRGCVFWERWCACVCLSVCVCVSEALGTRR